MIHQLRYSIAMVSSRMWLVGTVVMTCAALAGQALLSETNSSRQTASGAHTLHNGPPPDNAYPKLVDITASTGISFQHVSSPEQRYIVESMSGGVALID